MQGGPGTRSLVRHHCVCVCRGSIQLLLQGRVVLAQGLRQLKADLSSTPFPHRPRGAGIQLQYLKHDPCGPQPRKARLWSGSASSSGNWDVTYIPVPSKEIILGKPCSTIKLLSLNFKYVLLCNSSFPYFPNCSSPGPPSSILNTLLQ